MTFILNPIKQTKTVYIVSIYIIYSLYIERIQTMKII